MLPDCHGPPRRAWYCGWSFAMRGTMKIRKWIVALSGAAFLAASVNQSKAVPVTPPPPAVFVASTTATGVLVVGGFLGAIGLLCIYDFGLKLNGLKNWDGTP